MSQPFHHIQSLLSPEDLQEIDALVTGANFADGKATASMAAKQVKNNLQLDKQDGAYKAILSVINRAVENSNYFQAAAQPKSIYPFIISKYGAGQFYGWHVDSPLMGDPMIRTDMAMTIFLSDPATYEGGELVLQGAAGPVAFKPAKGDAILYPCQFLHCVNEIRSGERLAAITWLQSNIRSAEQRQLLFELNQVQGVLQQRDPQSPESALMLQAYSNLFRMWADV